MAGLTKFARYDRSTGLIALNIPDPNLYLAIENHIEEQGGYVEIQLNRKLLKTRVEYYVELLASGEGKEAEEVIKRIKKEIKSDEKKYSIDNGFPWKDARGFGYSYHHDFKQCSEHGTDRKLYHRSV